jgi:LPS-assembly lipoprotein
LSGCGFTPLYSRGTEAADERLATIRVSPIPDRLGQRLANDLRDTFNPLGRKVDATHALYVSLVTERREVAVRRDGTASRVEVVVNANYTLADLSTQRSVLTGIARSRDTFDLVDNEYANVIAGESAQSRTLRFISEEIRTRIALFLDQ